MKSKNSLCIVGVLLFPLIAAAAQEQPPAESLPRHVEGELLVKFAGGPRGAAAEQARARMQHGVKRHFEFIGWQQIRLPHGMSVEEGLARYRNLAGVVAVEPNGLMSVMEPAPAQRGFQPAGDPFPVVPNDPMFPQQWGLANIGATNAWAATTGSTNVVVAVVDSGINYRHEDLAANMWRNPGEIPGNALDDDGNGFVDDVYGIDTADDAFGNDSDPYDQAGNGNYHGTACAGLIGAVGNNAVGVAGVNWSVQLMALRIYQTTGFTTFADHIQALAYIMLMKGRGVNIQVINMSYGSPTFFSQAMKDAHDGVAALGILQVAGAGNDATDSDGTPFFPASLNISNLLSVAASEQLDHMAGFSNYGRTNVDLAAPGVDIAACSGPGSNSYVTNLYGTSFATPHVAGAAALLFAANPGATAEDVKAALLETVDVLPAFTNKMVSNGRLNVGRAMLHPRVATGPPVVAIPPQSHTVVLSNSATLSALGGGTRPLHYQWLFNGTELADATNTALTLASVSLGQAGEYRLVVTNAMGSVTSQVATLTVVPLWITSHPQSQNIRLNANATNSVSVTSPVPVHYQWRFNGANLAEPDERTLMLPNVQLTNEGDYSVEVSNVFGSAVSSNAALVVLIDPVITIAPVSQSVVAGGSATFSVAFTGNPMPFGVEWRQGAVPKASNTLWRLNDFFTLTNAQPVNAGTWRVIVRNLAKNIASGENRTFNLTVLADSDGDGLPDAWETAYPMAANPAEDTDHDGLSNLQEYQAGTDPADSQSYLHVENIAHVAGSNAFSLRFSAAAGKTYTIQQRTTAEAGAWSRLMDIIASPTNRLIEVIDPGPMESDRRFYRVATPRLP